MKRNITIQIDQNFMTLIHDDFYKYLLAHKFQTFINFLIICTFLLCNFKIKSKITKKYANVNTSRVWQGQSCCYFPC